MDRRLQRRCCRSSAPRRPPFAALVILLLQQRQRQSACHTGLPAAGMPEGRVAISRTPAVMSSA
jgi:hypothetical protein